MVQAAGWPDSRLDSAEEAGNGDNRRKKRRKANGR